MLTFEEKKFLEEATDFFVNPGVVARGLMYFGKPVEALHDRLPTRAKNAISTATRKAVEKGLLAAIETVPPSSTSHPQYEKSKFSGLLHKTSTAVAGGLAGFFGLPALAVELPVTTVLILRGISEQAQIFGEDLGHLETRLECLMIFALGSATTTKDDAIESSYFLARAMHAQLIRQAADAVAKMSAKEMLDVVNKGTAPVLVRLISQIAQIFEIRVSQKVLAEMMPVVGAVGGAALNYAFTEFYCTTAKYHFGIRALERRYGSDLVHEVMKQRLSSKKTTNNSRGQF